MSLETIRTVAADVNKGSSSTPDRAKLMRKMVLRLVLIPIGLGALLFVSAGTWKWWQGWAYLAAMTVPVAATFLRIANRDPQLLERRMHSKEEIGEQRWLIRVSKPLFVVGYLLPGLDFRLGWSHMLVGAVPVWLCLLAYAAILAGLGLVAWVLEVNTFAARTIRVEQAQTVVSNGPYRIVRHPMYAGSVVLWAFTPLALGSWVALPFSLLLAPFYVLRLLNEEKVLREQLPRYSEYCRQTRWRLLPRIW